MLPYAHVSNLLFFFLVQVRDTSLVTLLTEFKMLVPDGATLQPFQAVVMSPQLGSSISVKLAKKNKIKCVFFLLI